MKSKLYKIIVTLSLAMTILTACNPGDVMTKSNPIYDNAPVITCSVLDEALGKCKR